MKQGIFKTVSNERIADKTYRMVLEGDASEVKTPGQFVSIGLEGFFLRRPFSVCDREGDFITVIYKTVGSGTNAMSRLRSGTELNLLTGLGNGYDIKKAGGAPLIIGGGAGVPPLFFLCKSLIAENILPVVILGFNTSSEVFYEREFRALGAEVLVSTADGSLGQKGFVTDIMKKLEYSFFYACGPVPMYKAINAIAETNGEFSLEARMGCGFGACMGCSVMTRNGAKRICKDGPVFERRELLW